MGDLLNLIYLFIFIIIGLILSKINKKLNIKNSLLFLIGGIILGKLSYGGVQLIRFNDDSFLQVLSALIIIMVTFDIFSRIKIKELNEDHYNISKFSVFLFLISIIVLSIIINKIFISSSYLHAILLSLLLLGIDRGMIEKKKNNSKLNIMLKNESVINDSMMILISILIINIILFSNNTSQFELIGYFMFLIPNILLSIGLGIIIGLIFFKYLRKKYHVQISPLILLATLILTYYAAKLIGAFSIFSIATIGFFFGNIYINKKEELAEFSKSFSKTIEIIIFLIIGTIININFSLYMILNSIILFAVLILIRYLFIQGFYNKRLDNKEKTYLALNIPKGIVTIALILFIALKNIQGMEVILQTSFLIILYSLVLDLIIKKYFN